MDGGHPPPAPAPPARFSRIVASVHAHARMLPSLHMLPAKHAKKDGTVQTVRWSGGALRCVLEQSPGSWMLRIPNSHYCLGRCRTRRAPALSLSASAENMMRQSVSQSRAVTRHTPLSYRSLSRQRAGGQATRLLLSGPAMRRRAVGGRVAPCLHIGPSPRKCIAAARIHLATLRSLLLTIAHSLTLPPTHTRRPQLPPSTPPGSSTSSGATMAIAALAAPVPALLPASDTAGCAAACASDSTLSPLPPELLLLVAEHGLSLADVAALVRVNSLWHAACVPALYRQITLGVACDAGEADAKGAGAGCPAAHLHRYARHVRALDVRPRAERTGVLPPALRALRLRMHRRGIDLADVADCGPEPVPLLVLDRPPLFAHFAFLPELPAARRTAVIVRQPPASAEPHPSELLVLPLGHLLLSLGVDARTRPQVAVLFDSGAEPYESRHTHYKRLYHFLASKGSLALLEHAAMAPVTVVLPDWVAPDAACLGALRTELRARSARIHAARPEWADSGLKKLRLLRLSEYLASAESDHVFAPAERRRWEHEVEQRRTEADVMHASARCAVTPARIAQWLAVYREDP